MLQAHVSTSDELACKNAPQEATKDVCALNQTYGSFCLTRPTQADVDPTINEGVVRSKQQRLNFDATYYVMKDFSRTPAMPRFGEPTNRLLEENNVMEFDFEWDGLNRK